MEFIFRPPVLWILIYVYSREEPLVSDVKIALQSFYGDTLVSDLKSLSESGKILIDNETKISLSPTAIDFLKNYHNFGSAHIFEDKLDLAVLEFLYNINSPVPIKFFPKIILEKAPVTSKGSVSEDWNLEGWLLYNPNIKNYIEGGRYDIKLKDSGRRYYESFIKKQEKYFADSDLQNQIDKLTLKSLKYQDRNQELKTQLDKALLDLSFAQKADIPINATDRKTVIVWQIATGVAVIVAFLLKLFGVQGWL